jgi:hypothetical protein
MVNVRLLVLLLTGIFAGLTTIAGDQILNVNSPQTINDPIVTDGLIIKVGNGTATILNTVQSGGIDIRKGTLLIGADNLIADGTPIELSGGTLAINGHSDTMGALTLTENSTIDLGTSGNSILTFYNTSSSIWDSAATLTIVNWSPGDQLVFGSLTEAQMSQIVFVNPGGLTGTFNARILPNGEIVPVPEPATIGFGALLLGSIGFRERKRVADICRALRKKLAS